MDNKALDRFLAEEVMGFVKNEPTISGYHSPMKEKDCLPSYVIYDWHPSTNIEQVLMCAEKYLDDNDCYIEMITKSWKVGKYKQGKGHSHEYAHYYIDQLGKWYGGIVAETRGLAISFALYETVKGG